MNRSRATAVFVRSAIAVAIAATLVACSSEGDNFCNAYEDSGGTWETIGPLAWRTKEGVTEELTVTLAVMGDLQPPAEISDAWAASKTYYEENLGLVDELSAGESFAPDANEAGKAFDDFNAISAWYRNTCT